jgi:hypothetical protein
MVAIPAQSAMTTNRGHQSVEHRSAWTRGKPRDAKGSATLKGISGGDSAGSIRTGNGPKNA